MENLVRLALETALELNRNTDITVNHLLQELTDPEVQEALVVKTFGHSIGDENRAQWCKLVREFMRISGKYSYNCTESERAIYHSRIQRGVSATHISILMSNISVYHHTLVEGLIYAATSESHCFQCYADKNHRLHRTIYYKSGGVWAALYHLRKVDDRKVDNSNFAGFIGDVHVEDGNDTDYLYQQIERMRVYEANFGPHFNIDLVDVPTFKPEHDYIQKAIKSKPKGPLW